MMLIATSIAIVVAPAHGQSINIDYGAGAGAPDATYAGAGVAGAWNALSDATPPQALVDVRGNPTNVTITLSNGQLHTMDDPSTSGGDEALLDDGILGGSDEVFDITIEGLRPDAYELIVYGWRPAQPSDLTVLFYPGAFQVVGGPWPGSLEPPITHDIRVVNGASGTLEFSFAGAEVGDTGFINGIQLLRLTPADFNRDGVVDALDVLATLAYWGPCAPDCPGNVNGDDVVDYTDLYLVFEDWD
jgi:hypothetical protein